MIPADPSTVLSRDQSALSPVAYPTSPWMSASASASHGAAAPVFSSVQRAALAGMQRALSCTAWCVVRWQLIHAAHEWLR